VREFVVLGFWKKVVHARVVLWGVFDGITERQASLERQYPMVVIVTDHSAYILDRGSDRAQTVFHYASTAAAVVFLAAEPLFGLRKDDFPFRIDYANSSVMRVLVQAYD
jgi:hypothetical protein